MTHKVGVKGQVVIPKAIREQIGIRPGDEVSFDSDGEEVRIRRASDAAGFRGDRIKAMRGIWASTGTDALLAERRRERELEERRARGRGVGRL